MEYQSTHFDALSCLFVLSTWDVESGMWHTPSSAIFLRVEALNKYNFLRAEMRLVVPTVLTINLHTEMENSPGS